MNRQIKSSWIAITVLMWSETASAQGPEWFYPIVTPQIGVGFSSPSKLEYGLEVSSYKGLDDGGYIPILAAGFGVDYTHSEGYSCLGALAKIGIFGSLGVGLGPAVINERYGMESDAWVNFVVVGLRYKNATSSEGTRHSLLVFTPMWYLLLLASKP